MIDVYTLSGEVRRVLARIERLGRSRSGLMYREQDRFDRKASERMRKNALNSDILIGMPQACLESFKTHSDSFRVLHVVNGHPRAHNEAITGSGAASNSHEYVPNYVIDRVEAEVALADLLLVPSQVVKSGFEKYGVSASKILIRPYGVDQQMFSCNTPLRQRSRDLTYIGQISYRKGFDLLVEAMRRLPRRNLSVAGPVVSSELLQNLPSNVSYLGRLSRDETAALLADSRNAIIASREDAYPLFALEALAAGCHLVASTKIGTMDLIADRDVTTFEPSHAGNLVDVLAEDDTVEAPTTASYVPWTWTDYADSVMTAIHSRAAVERRV